MPPPDPKPDGLSRLLRDVQGPPSRRLPLRISQQTAWVIDHLPGRSRATRHVLSLRILGDLDVEALRRGIAEIQRRHEILRGNVESCGGKPVLLIPSTCEIPWSFYDDAVDPAEPVPAEKPSASSLWTVELSRRRERDHILRFEFHQLLLDGDSIEVLFDELTEHYAAFASGSDPWLGPVELEYGSLPVSMAQLLSTEGIRKAREHFQKELSGILRVGMPPEFPGSISPSQGSPLTVPIPADDMLLYEERCRDHGGGHPPAAVLLAAVATVLHRYSGESDILLALETSVRFGSAHAGVVGPLTEAVPLRVSCDPDASFESLTTVCAEALDRAQRNRGLCLEETLRCREKGESSAPSFSPRVLFRYRGRGWNLPDLGDAQVVLLEDHPPLGAFALLIDFRDGPGGLTLTLHYDPTALNHGTVSRMGEHVTAALRSGLVDARRTAQELPILSSRERALVVEEWNQTAHSFRDQLGIHQLFEEQVRTRPAADAIICDGARVTYSALNAMANRVAQRLRAEGVVRGTPVGVWRERSIELIVAILGVAKSGGAYIPLHPHWPTARVAQILDSVGAVHLLTQASFLSRLDLEPDASSSEPQLLLRRDSVDPGVAWKSTSCHGSPIEVLDPAPLHSPESPAYIIFTSGSTGVPKGVVVSHRAVVNTLEWVNRTFGIGPSDRGLFVTSICFDLSVYDIFGLLGAGASVHVATEAEVREPGDLAQLLCSEPITFWNSAPAYLGSLIPFLGLHPGAHPDRLRLVFLSGDWIPVTLPDQVRRHFTSAEVVSLGGATEAAIWSNFHRIDRVDPARPSIPYGRPIQNSEYYVLDVFGEPCPIGVPGHLYIAGTCLASGYANDPEQTALKFPAHPFPQRGTTAGENRAYATGDLARWWPDGSLEFLGRRDQQVKIRGYRIELEEIEAVLRHHPSVQDCAVVVLGESGEGQRLVAVVVAGAQAAPVQWREHLALHLPQYMVPDEFVVRDSLPLTQNGKLDRKGVMASARLCTVPASVSSGLSFPSWSPLAAKLRDIWEEVLGVSVNDPLLTFFELGGNSIKAGALVARLSRSLQVKLPIRAVFDHPTIPLMADHLASILREGRGSSDRRAA